MIGLSAAADIGGDVIPTGGLAVLVALAGLFIRNMLQDRGAGFDMAKSADARIATLERRVEANAAELQSQRGIKHDIRQDLTRTMYPLEMVLDAEDFARIEWLKPTIQHVIEEVRRHEEERRDLERKLAEQRSQA